MSSALQPNSSLKFMRAGVQYFSTLNNSTLKFVMQVFSTLKCSTPCVQHSEQQHFEVRHSGVQYFDV